MSDDLASWVDPVAGPQVVIATQDEFPTLARFTARFTTVKEAAMAQGWELVHEEAFTRLVEFVATDYPGYQERLGLAPSATLPVIETATLPSASAVGISVRSADAAARIEMAAGSMTLARETYDLHVDVTDVDTSTWGEFWAALDTNEPLLRHGNSSTALIGFTLRMLHDGVLIRAQCTSPASRDQVSESMLTAERGHLRLFALAAERALA